MLSVTNFSASINGRQIFQNINFHLSPGKLTVLMGPNGSGKSTLGFALAGHPNYQVGETSKIVLNKKDLTTSKPEERAKAGLFLGFQHPTAIPGVNFTSFLRQSYNTTEPLSSRRLGPLEFYHYLESKAAILKIPKELLSRSLNDEFSGGEKKRMEMLQALVLRPKYAILDEPDTGTDVDSLKLIAKSIAVLQRQGVGVLLITHYQRLLSYLSPNRVIVLKSGRIAASGGPDLIAKIESHGYDIL